MRRRAYTQIGGFLQSEPAMALRWGLTIFGLVLVILGTTFALQGANMFPGRSFMNGNPTWIYIGGALDVIGLILVVVGTAGKSRAPLTPTPADPNQAR